MNAATQAKRSAWPYAIAAYFALAITGIVIFITWAVKQNMELVRSDYYEHEILFQKQIDAAIRTKGLGPEVVVKTLPEMHRISIKIPAGHVNNTLEGRAHLYRPNDSRMDQHHALAPAAAGEQVISTEGLAPGLWRLRLEWTANGAAYLHEEPLILGN